MCNNLSSHSKSKAFNSCLIDSGYSVKLLLKYFIEFQAQTREKTE